MTIEPAILWIIIGCAIVTWIPRIAPFAFVRSIQLPDVMLKWLSYIPVCILSALVIEQLLTKENAFVVIDWPIFIAFLPSLLVAVFTKSLSLTVLVGVVTMAAIRVVL